MARVRTLIRLVAFLSSVLALSGLLSFSIVDLAAQRERSLTTHAVLNVVALDDQGRPVTDLKANEFQVYDQGKPEPIVLFERSTGTHPVVILFDLLNANLTERENGKHGIVVALEHLESSDSLYLYLLTSGGDLYPLHAVPPQSAETEPEPTPWTVRIRSMLDDAMNRVNALRPTDERDVGTRIGTTYKALDVLTSKIAPISGAKSIVWVTPDVPYADTHSDYYASIVRRLASTIDNADIAVNIVATESVPENMATAQFTGMTGGQTYSNDVKEAVADAMIAARSSYRIEYVQPRPDDKTHKIRLVCARKGIRIRTKQEYFAYGP